MRRVRCVPISGAVYSCRLSLLLSGPVTVLCTFSVPGGAFPRCRTFPTPFFRFVTVLRLVVHGDLWCRAASSPLRAPFRGVKVFHGVGSFFPQCMSFVHLCAVLVLFLQWCRFRSCRWSQFARCRCRCRVRNGGSPPLYAPPASPPPLYSGESLLVSWFILLLSASASAPCCGESWLAFPGQRHTISICQRARDFAKFSRCGSVAACIRCAVPCR